MPSGIYQRTPKEYQKPTITSILLHLEIGEFAVFPIRESVVNTLSMISTTWGQRKVLHTRKFKNETHLLVRESEVSIPVIVTTRVS